MASYFYDSRIAIAFIVGAIIFTILIAYMAWRVLRTFEDEDR